MSPRVSAAPSSKECPVKVPVSHHEELTRERIFAPLVFVERIEVVSAGDREEAPALVRPDRLGAVIRDGCVLATDGYASRAATGVELGQQHTILTLTARRKSVEIAHGIGAGADDSFVKPFSSPGPGGGR